MVYLVAGTVALVILLILGNRASSANTAKLIRVLRKILGGALLILAGYFAFQRHLPYMMTVGSAGLALLGWDRLFGRKNFQTTQNQGASNISSVRSEFLEMELDQSINSISGRVINGKFSGANLSDLSEQELIELLNECSVDEQSKSLLEAYLDRYMPDWREQFSYTQSNGSNTTSSDGKMTREEAYEILGLKSGASDKEIMEAHKKLINQLHPDRGGTNYLAATINRAKDTLLGKT